MPRVVLSTQAQKDLARVHNFLAQWDTGIAKAAVNTITNAFEKLTMPGIGAPVPNGKGMRKLVIDYGSSGYTALYRYSEKHNVITVLAIKHQKEHRYHSLSTDIAQK